MDVVVRSRDTMGRSRYARRAHNVSRVLMHQGLANRAAARTDAEAEASSGGGGWGDTRRIEADGTPGAAHIDGAPTPPPPFAHGRAARGDERQHHGQQPPTYYPLPPGGSGEAPPATPAAPPGTTPPGMAHSLSAAAHPPTPTRRLSAASAARPAARRRESPSSSCYRQPFRQSSGLSEAACDTLTQLSYKPWQYTSRGDEVGLCYPWGGAMCDPSHDGSRPRLTYAAAVDVCTAQQARVCTFQEASLIRQRDDCSKGNQRQSRVWSQSRGGCAEGERQVLTPKPSVYSIGLGETAEHLEYVSPW